MTDNHPITPPRELVQAFLRSNPFTPAEMTYEQFIATRFARWGADQELEACCEWIESESCLTNSVMAKRLRDARRPTPLSLKEQALELVDRIEKAESVWAMSELDTIRRALEQLND